jgi:hypothetical protein
MIRDGLTLCPVLLLNWVAVRREIILGSETRSGASEWTRTIDPHHVKVVL